MQLGTDAAYITTAPQAFLYEKDGTGRMKCCPGGFSSGFLTSPKTALMPVPGSLYRHTTDIAGI